MGVSGASKWYYEVTLESNGQILIGFATSTIGLGPDTQLGTDDRSWGWDGSQCQKFTGGKCEGFGDKTWKVGDVIGVLLDLDQRRISFSRNGVSLGVCFTDIPKDQLLYPAVSLRRYQRVTCNFGGTPFRYPDHSAFSFHLFLNEKQVAALEKLFEHYQKIGMDLSQSQEDRGDVCKADGVFQFASDVGAVDDTDPLLLVIAWKLKGEKPWEFTREEWVRGFSMYGLHDIASIKTTSHKWKSDIFKDDDAFKPFYNWTFDYLREDRKILSIEEVKTLWSMLGMANRWQLWNRWLEFVLDKKKRQYLSRDEWCVVLTFAMEHKDGIESYDPEGPWPVLMDDFVQFVKGELDDE